MEIYHRDHWIMIVPMAKWKDLTKWNEENTMMDWINHMGRITSVCFLCLRTVSAKAMRLKKILWYIMYYLLSLYIKSQTPGTRLCQSVLGCTWLY